jgi:hypothetical protein
MTLDRAVHGTDHEPAPTKSNPTARTRCRARTNPPAPSRVPGPGAIAVPMAIPISVPAVVAAQLRAVSPMASAAATPTLPVWP